MVVKEIICKPGSLLFYPFFHEFMSRVNNRAQANSIIQV